MIFRHQKKMPWQKYESHALMQYVLDNLDTSSVSSRRNKEVSFNYEETAAIYFFFSINSAPS